MATVKKYTSLDGTYYVISDNNGNKQYGILTDGSILETVHNVEFISETKYEAERPKPIEQMEYRKI